MAARSGLNLLGLLERMAVMDVPDSKRAYTSHPRDSPSASRSAAIPALPLHIWQEDGEWFARTCIDGDSRNVNLSCQAFGRAFAGLRAIQPKDKDSAVLAFLQWRWSQVRVAAETE